MRRSARVFTLLTALALSAAVAGTAEARPTLPEGGMAKKRSVDVNVAGFDKQHGPHSQLECVASANGAANVKLDCDDPVPNNEPDIEVDPADPRHMIASSNDYGTCCDQFYTSFDSGQTWQTGNMSRKNPGKTGSDPVTVFDVKHGVAIHSSLNYNVQHAAGTQACDGDLVVSISRDGGVIWEVPVTVDDGQGCDLSKTQLFNDKEWIVTDNNPGSPFYGRTYLTWSKFESHDGVYASSAIFESHSDDGGAELVAAAGDLWLEPGALHIPGERTRWRMRREPVLGSDGRPGRHGLRGVRERAERVSLGSAGNVRQPVPPGAVDQRRRNLGRAQLSSSGLRTARTTIRLNVDGRQTLTGYQVRVNSAGNIVASPTDGTLYLTFSDNRNGVHNSATPVTNTDVFVMSSTNGGVTWTSPVAVDTGSGDQWFPWVDVDPTTGKIGVIYHDRGGANGPLYTTALAEGTPGSLVKTTVSTAPSNPTDSLFFQAGAVGCEKCATFHGDYIGVSYGSDGVANLAWTDMRDFVENGPFGTGFSQFIYFARH